MIPSRTASSRKDSHGCGHCVLSYCERRIRAHTRLTRAAARCKSQRVRQRWGTSIHLADSELPSTILIKHEGCSEEKEAEVDMGEPLLPKGRKMRKKLNERFINLRAEAWGTVQNSRGRCKVPNVYKLVEIDIVQPRTRQSSVSADSPPITR